MWPVSQVKINFLAVVSTLRADATIQTSVVNAGVLTHPFTGIDVVGFVTYGKAKLANLRARPQMTITFRSGWQWASVEGRAELIGPDDPHAGVPHTDVPDTDVPDTDVPDTDVNDWEPKRSD